MAETVRYQPDSFAEIKDLPNRRLLVRLGEKIGGAYGRFLARWTPSLFSYNGQAIKQSESPEKSLTTAVGLGLAEAGGVATMFFDPVIGGIIYFVSRAANHIGENYHRSRIMLQQRGRTAR